MACGNFQLGRRLEGIREGSLTLRRRLGELGDLERRRSVPLARRLGCQLGILDFR